MRWQGRRRSENVEDRRGARHGLPGLSMGGRLPIGGRGGLGLGGLLIVVVISMLFGVDPLAMLGGSGPSMQTDEMSTTHSAEAETLKAFVTTVLADTEDTWHNAFAAAGKRYKEPTLVLFSGGVESGCGFASAAVGPFYCPSDRKVYLDLDFYSELKSRFGAPGDFAQAYVLAHEVGHHVQNELGLMTEANRLRAQASETESNAISVLIELQADCFAGIWAHDADRSRALVEAGDIEEALAAAAAVGDDTLQRKAQGHVVPESFTHGSAAERRAWFKRGFDSGLLEACNTFAQAGLE